jgi:hypothetical protein
MGVNLVVLLILHDPKCKAEASILLPNVSVETREHKAARRQYGWWANRLNGTQQSG